MATSDVRIRQVAGRKDLGRFVQLPMRLFRDDRNFVPPLLLDVLHRLDRRRNAFFTHSEADYFLAERGGRVVGRIAAIRNRRHEAVHDEKVGFFGWFDCENDVTVAGALLDRVRDYARERGLTRLRGPASFSLNDECGVLIEGNDLPPAVLMPWNPPYYRDLLEAAGCEKARDLISYFLPVQDFGIERIGRIVAKVRAREKATVRPFDKRNFPAEVARFKEIYNGAWEKNWGFVALTDAEIDQLARDLKPVLEPRLANFVEVDGRAVGFSLVLPDVNEVLARMSGRLLPLGLFKLLFGLPRVKNIRLIAMGMLPEFQQRGLDAVLYHASFEASDALGKETSEIGWVLEDNVVMRNTIERIGGRRFKTHRIYETSTSPTATAACHGKGGALD